jgi:hypothetical protein
MVNGFADRVILGESLDVLESFFVNGFPSERDVLLGEARKDGRPI